MRLRPIAALVLFASVTALPAPASALLVRYGYTAEIAAILEGDPTLLPVGTQIAGSFVVDTAAAPQAPGSIPDRLDTGVTKSAYGFALDATLDVPGLDFGFPALGHYDVVVYDDHACTAEQAFGDPILCFPDRTAPTDELAFGVFDDFFDPTSGWYADVSVHVEESGASPSMLDSIRIPETAPQSATGVSGGALWLAQEGGAAYTAELTAVTFTSAVLPEPGRALLLLPGFAALAAARTRSAGPRGPRRP